MGVELSGACGFSSVAFADNKKRLKKRPLHGHRGLLLLRKRESAVFKQLVELNETS